MRSRRLIPELVGVALAVSLVGCGPEWVNTDGKDQNNDDIATALSALGDATVLTYTLDGVPTHIVGEMARIGDGQIDDLAQAEAAIRPALRPVLAAFRMTTDEVKLRKVNVDEMGLRHYRFDMVADGMDVIGGDMVVHVDIKGAISGISGNGRGDLPRDGSDDISASSAVSRVAQDSRFDQLATSTPRMVYLITADSKRYRAFEVMVEGYRGEDPARDAVYVDAATGDIVAVHPKIHFARNRRVHSANNGTSLPGTVRRTEGQAATTDVDVNAAYDNSGATYNMYNFFWGRDSYNNAGALLSSTVHYSTNYCNAFWDGTQMVYGDGNGSSCLPLARSVDVTAHELTHAVTEYESNLTYSGESGGINEAMSDIFGAVTEAYVDGGSTGTLAVSGPVWLIGDEILPPYLRRMDDPRADGVSKDFWYSGLGSVDVHYSSGVANLAFYLLSQGGTHPRSETTTNVTGIGIEKAARIFYKANADKLTSSSNYAALRLAAEQSAAELGYSTAEQASVSCAFAAVKVGTAPTSCGGTTEPPPTEVVLTNATPVTGISGATGNEKFYRLVVPSGQTNLVFTISGGTGDADMYVLLGSRPTQTSYSCRPYLNGNNETCTYANPAAGTYYVMLRGYAAYSGVTLTGTYTSTTTAPGDPYLQDGVPVTGQSGATSSWKYWRVAVTAGTSYTVAISGGTGDADLYTRLGSRPTTSSYICRPYLNGNAETCTYTATSSGDLFVGVRGYSAYSGVSVRADW